MIKMAPSPIGILLEMDRKGSGLTGKVLRLTVTSSVTLARTILILAVMVPRLAGRAKR